MHICISHMPYTNHLSCICAQASCYYDSFLLYQLPKLSVIYSFHIQYVG